MGQKQAKRFTFSILMLMIGYAFINSTPSLFMNGMIKDFQLPNVEQGLISSIMNVGGLIALVSMPLLQGRVKKWTMLLISGLIQFVISLCLGTVPLFWFVLAAYLILGLGLGLMDSYANSCIADINNGSQKHMALMHGTYGIGAFAAPLIIQWLFEPPRNLPWQTVNYMIAAFVGALVLFFVLQTRRDSGIVSAASIDEPKLRMGEIKEYLKNKYNVQLIGAGVMYNASMAVSSLWVVRYATVTYNDATSGAVALSVCWLCSTISRFVAPALKKRPLKLFAIGVSSMGLLQMAGVLAGNQIMLIVAYGAIGLMSGQCMPMLMNELTIKYPGRTSLPTSVSLFFMYCARIIMPIVVGYIAAISNIAVGMLLPLITSLLGGWLSFVALRSDKSAA